MYTLRILQRLKPGLSPHGNISLRSLTVKPDVAKEDDGVVVTHLSPPQLLSQFISPHTGHIYARHFTGLCGVKQKQVAKAIKKAQSMGFMSVTHKHPQFMRDPNICAVKQLN
ncbi:28S ribosomal protein S18c, mitochondrial [Takifugu flavidus]|uniref:28S ribosomal protein S18c, mitochondrial n=1 Tax=Takifugu flavidus TaxID=433684 RepID=A0A5C6NJA7_9TELE|nr:28S ribosomal protein S18c, mitochondrial [Takifugu flavidus]